MEKYVSSEVKPKKSLEELRREGVELKRKINEDINEKRNRVILFFYKTTQFLLKCDLRQISKCY